MYERNLKYRHKIVEGVRNPQGFNMLKDFWNNSSAIQLFSFNGKNLKTRSIAFFIIFKFFHYFVSTHANMISNRFKF